MFLNNHAREKSSAQWHPLSPGAANSTDLLVVRRLRRQCIAVQSVRRRPPLGYSQKFMIPCGNLVRGGKKFAEAKRDQARNFLVRIPAILLGPDVVLHASAYPNGFR
jgi:hypothetical protein